MPRQCEWGFDVPSEEVDLERICVEVNGIPAATAILYMYNLKKEAPIVWNRLKKWAQENKRMTWYTWRKE